jgi:SAM-dependent methyltransferase
MEHPYADVTAQNRNYWEAIAPDRRGEPVAFFESGGSALTPAELAVIGDPAGQRVLQLACSMGDESLTLAQRGAEVTAVDISPTHLGTGRQKASALGLTVDFREQDMMNLDPELTGFDLIYISSGGVCWVPELHAWAADIAARLKPSGQLLINEHHPLWEVLTVTGENELAVSGDYLRPDRPRYTDMLKAPQAAQGRTGLPDHTSYVWSLGRMVTALLAAGLTIRSLQEAGEPGMYPGLGESAGRVPATYLLAASREH